jgi:hypothetical protein
MTGLVHNPDPLIRFQNIADNAPLRLADNSDKDDKIIIRLERTILFLQTQHSETLNDLHKEINRLQEMCCGIYI